jgi:outer membrane protein assembly factor BamB
MKLRTEIALVVVLLGAAFAPAADWPLQGRDNRRSGVTPETPAAPVALVESWVCRPPHPPQPAWYGPAKRDAFARVEPLQSMRAYDKAFHVAVAEGLLYFGSTADDAVHCLDAGTGREKWTFFTGGPVRNAPSCYDERVYFGSDDGFAYCLDARTGEKIWSYSPNPAARRILFNGKLVSPWPCRTGVLVVDGTAYCGFSMLPWEQSFLCALDAATGKPSGEGRYALAQGGLTLEAPLALAGDRLVAPQGRVPPAMFARTTGKKLLSLKKGGGSFVVVTPDERVLHGPGNKKGWINDSSLADPAKLVTHNSARVMRVQGGRSYLLMDDRVACMDRVTKKTVWQRTGTYPFSMIVAGDTLFVGGVDRVAALKTADGALLWSGDVRGKAYGLAFASERLYVSTGEGHIHCFAAGGASLPRKDDLRKPVAARAVEPSPPVYELSHPALLDRWVFHRGAMQDGQGRVPQSRVVPDGTVRNLAGRLPGKLAGSWPVTRAGRVEALVLDGSRRCVEVAGTLAEAKLPARTVTAEAWVRVDKPLQWGGIVGAIQDNGSFERGWLLGYCNARFAFAVAGKEANGRLTYLQAPEDFVPGAWYHVVGTYDGATMRLYVNGAKVSETTAQKGDINYPPETTYQVGVYRDKDEYFPMTGQLHAVCVYAASLPGTTIQNGYEAQRDAFPRPQPEPVHVRLAVGPWLRFTGPSTADVFWETTKPCPTHVEWGEGVCTRTNRTSAVGCSHKMALEGLRADRVYTYRIVVDDGQTHGVTKDYECDTFFNYSPAAPAAGGKPGYAVVVGCPDEGEQLLALAQDSRWTVVGLDTDARRIEAARARLSRIGVYGSRCLAYRVDSLSNLSLPGRFADHVVLTDGNKPAPAAELARLRRPRGGDDADWTHLYARPDNSGYAGETLGGATSTDDFEVQWIGRPGPRFQSDRSGRKPSPLVANGRLFVQGLGRVLCVDAYNGAVQWSLEVPEFLRFNVPRDGSNWCVDDDTVFMAVRDACWCLDARTGEVLRRYPALSAGRSDWRYDWGYIARAGDLVFGTAVKEGTAPVDFYGGAGWYDKPSGPSTLKVCSDNFFALREKDGSTVWHYANGLVVNATVSIGERYAFFVETRNAGLMQGEQRRLEGQAFWQDQHLVCIDTRDGSVRWQRPIDTFDGATMFVMAQSQGRLVLMASGNNRYHVYAYDAGTGKDQWHTEYGWPGNNHGMHMSRPAIVGERVFARPAVLELATGKVLPQKIPGKFRGCSTYAATSHALIYRNSGVTIWGHESQKQTTWGRLRPDCWLSTIPACGLLLLPEAGGGCSCGSWMEMSIAFAPKTK